MSRERRYGDSCRGLTRSANPKALAFSNEMIVKSMAEATSVCGIRRFVFISSNLAALPVGPYGESKAKCEQIIEQSSVRDWVILRLSPFLSLEVNAKNSRTGQLIHQVRRHMPVFLPDKGRFVMAPMIDSDFNKLVASICGNPQRFRKKYNLEGKPYMLSDILASLR